MMRRTGITADEVVGLAGLGPLTPLAIYRRKLRPPRDRPGGGSTWRATVIPAVLAAYEKHVGLKPHRQQMFRNPIQRFAISESYFAVDSPVDATRLVLPFKLDCAPWLALPPPLVVKAQWGLGVTGHEQADVAILFRSTLKVFCVHFDLGGFDALYEIAEIFMSNYCLQGIPPPGGK
jgi:hypothetical protein